MKEFSSPIRIRDTDGSEEDGAWRVVVNCDYADALERAGLKSFRDYFDLQNGTTIKKLRSRSVVRVEIARSVFFLKRYETERQQIHAQSQSSPVPYSSEGGKEFANYCAFRKDGLATAVPVAMGERMFADGTIESFLLTEDFSPYVQIERIIRYEPAKLAGPGNEDTRQNILRAVACYARNMHNRGFNHQDFNATHLLLSDLEADSPRVALFDLQRVDRNRLKKVQWPIKALAEFNYSSLENGVFSDADRIFLFRAYRNRGQGSLSLLEHIQWTLIQMKTKRIARHTAKIRARKRARSG